PYAGEASWDAAGDLRPEAESEEAGIEPFEGGAAARARSVPLPEESAAQDSIAQADSIPESGPPNRAAEGPFVDAAPETAVVFAADDIGPAAKSEHSETAFASEGGLPMNAAEREPGEPGADIGAEGEDEVAEIEQLGGDAMEEMPARPHRQRRQYKIQEVIKRRQVLLVQVVKEERGNKGAALTTYLSLAGRYSVLMPNTARGGGISRKITDSTDRQRLKSIAQELEVPEGMGVIVRTAGAARTKAEVKRDFEYLLRMWETVRETTLQSSAPTLVYEEGSLIKRSIRDLYNKDIDAIVVAGEDAYREAKEFMRLLMPSHAKVVQSYRDPEPMFAKSGAEAQLDAMFSNQVTLKSGGYFVINQTEALVAIDVNSGRSTREHNIEDTALRTNLEAADEISRQLRLRDLAGLIVIDFIDMEENRNNRAVERRLKDALKNDRARIQIGRLSHFGLLEMSRQRMRTGVIEGSTVVCPHCAGFGMIRSTASIALHVLRVL
ncbi:MAG: Rne/Rng family ribonuclease, partial [Sphingomicrobium sp.]